MTDDTPARIYLCHNRNGHPRFEEVGPDDIGAEAWVPEGAGVRVKALEWHGPDFEDEYWAVGTDKTYRVFAMTERGRWCGGAGGHHPTVEAAKAAAQADYEARILAALEPVAQPEPGPGEASSKDGEANARLIAAAPDLYAALEKIAFDWAALEKIAFDWDGEPEDMFAAHAALAKARGEA